MSDITPPSYVDDGQSFSRRLPFSLANVSCWLDSPRSDAASAYTGSYIDDGADLLLPTTPGFGKINARFYKHKNHRNGEGEGTWNPNIAQAISGDIAHSLAKLRGLAHLEAKRPVRDKKEEKKKRERRRGVVSVPAPLKWGTFVIKGDDGRVVVIDEKGEYDSGPVQKAAEFVVSKGEGEKKTRGKRWVRAANSIDTPVSIPHIPRQEDTASNLRKGDNSASKSQSKSKPQPQESRPLSPIPESISSYSSDSIVKLSPLASPTNFVMTGGLSGWPSRAASHSPPPPVVPHAITWDTSSPPRGSHTRSQSRSQTEKKTKPASLTRSLPGEWPASPDSQSSDGSTFTDLKDRRSSKARSRRSSRHETDEGGFDKMSTKTYSEYQAPDIVDVIYDETPPGEVSYSQTGWDEDKIADAQSWGNNDEKQATEGWTGSRKNGSIKSFNRTSTVSDLGWGGSAKGSVWEGGKASVKRHSAQSWGINNVQSNNGSNNWDGFERPKTTSEVSVAGSGSEQSWLASQHSQHTHGSRHTHQSRRSHASHRSSRHGQTGWEGSQHSKHTNSNDDWGGSNTRSASSWVNASAAGSSPVKYANGFDEPNETYLNETWVGVPVRVASRRTSVAGWNTRGAKDV